MLHVLKVANSVSYNLGITSFSQAGPCTCSGDAMAKHACLLRQANHWQAAASFCKVLLQAGHSANEVTCVVACDACAPLWQTASASLASLTSLMSTPPTTRSLSSILSVCEKATAWAQSLRILHSFAIRHISANVITVNTAVSACQHAAWPHALSLLHTSAQDKAGWAVGRAVVCRSRCFSSMFASSRRLQTPSPGLPRKQHVSRRGKQPHPSFQGVAAFIRACPQSFLLSPRDRGWQSMQHKPLN